MSLDVWDGIFIGIYIGVFIGWWWNRKKPVVNANLVIDKTALDIIDQERVLAWLEAHELTWMPKGAVFDPNRKVVK